MKKTYPITDLIIYNTMTEQEFVAFVEGLLVGRKSLNRASVDAIRAQLTALRAVQRQEEEWASEWSEEIERIELADSPFITRMDLIDSDSYNKEEE